MSIYEVNRNTVNRRLAIRRAQREEAQRKAKQEAEEAALLADINEHARVFRAEMAAAQEAQRRENERRAAEAARQAEEARLQKERADHEKRYCLYWYLYVFLTILPLLIATMLIVVHEYGWLPIWILVPAAIACCAFSIFTFVDLAPWLDRETVKKFTATFRRKFRAYMLTPYSEMIR